MNKKLYITPELYSEFDSLDDYLQTIDRSHLTEDGLELPNPKPLVLHTGLDQPLTLQQQIERCFAVKLSDQVSRQGMETLEEANDFNVGEELVSNDALNSQYTIMENEYPDESLPITSGDQTSNSETPSPSKESESPPTADSPPQEPQASE